jgi:hypothetical protein
MIQKTTSLCSLHVSHLALIPEIAIYLLLILLSKSLFLPLNNSLYLSQNRRLVLRELPLLHSHAHLRQRNYFIRLLLLTQTAILLIPPYWLYLILRGGQMTLIGDGGPESATEGGKRATATLLGLLNECCEEYVDIPLFQGSQS